MEVGQGPKVGCSAKGKKKYAILMTKFGVYVRHSLHNNCNAPTQSLISRKKKVCLFFIHFHAVAAISTKFSVTPVQWVARQGREADHLPQSTVKVKNVGAIPPFPHMSSWHTA
jgi:hypothetical protein